MAWQGLVKCSSLFFIIFLMCPKRVRSTTPIRTQDSNFKSVKKLARVDQDQPAEDSIVLPEFPLNIFEQNLDDARLNDDEPGFDLTDDEIKKLKLWKKGIIIYYIDAVSFDKVLRDRIRLFLNRLNKLTKLNFVEVPQPPVGYDIRWVFFLNRRGQLDCADHSILNFTNEGVQRVNLGYDCLSTRGELAEAVLAILGVPAQHNSPDRDFYIKVNEDNIIPEKRYLFQKVKNDEWLFFDLKYDFASAGHFHQHKHSVAGHATIETQPIYDDTSVGGKNGLTLTDIKKIRMLYNYIINKREDEVTVCDTLFKNIGPYNRIKLSKKVKPRQKPNQYLGLPEKESIVLEVDIKDGEENKTPDENEAEEGEPEKGEPDQEEEAADDGTEPPTKKLDLKTRAKNRKPSIFKPDPLSYLSDYQTADEFSRKLKKGNIKKTKKKQ